MKKGLWLLLLLPMLSALEVHIIQPLPQLIAGSSYNLTYEFDSNREGGYTAYLNASGLNDVEVQVSGCTYSQNLFSCNRNMNTGNNRANLSIRLNPLLQPNNYTFLLWLMAEQEVASAPPSSPSDNYEYYMIDKQLRAMPKDQLTDSQLFNLYGERRNQTPIQGTPINHSTALQPPEQEPAPLTQPTSINAPDSQPSSPISAPASIKAEAPPPISKTPKSQPLDLGWILWAFVGLVVVGVIGYAYLWFSNRDGTPV